MVGRSFARVASLSAICAAISCSAGGTNKKPGDDNLEPVDPGSGFPGTDGAVSGPNGDGGFQSTPGSTLEPANATLFIDTSLSPLPPTTQTYVFKATDGTDLAPSATFTIEPSSLGTFAGPVFTSVADLPAGTLGLTGTVKAIAGGEIGEARVTIVKLRRTEDPATLSKDFFFEEPYKAPPSPSEDVLKFTTQINQVDVVFVMDTTASMGGEINNLKSSLKGTLIPELRRQIPSVGIGIAGHDDFPVGGYGSRGACSGSFAGDLPVYVLQRITTNEASARNAVDLLRLCGGNDIPESQIAAMFHVLTGGALGWSGGSVPAWTPAPGTSGGMNFRAGAVPVIVLITDAGWHNGTSAPYDGSITGVPNIPGLAAAFTKAGAKFVGVISEAGGANPHADAYALSEATSSRVPPSAFAGPCPAGQCCTGKAGAGRAPEGGQCRLVFDVDANGSGMGNTVVTAVKAIASGSVYDLLPVVSNDPTNAAGVDAVASFMDRLEAVAPGSPGAPPECAGTPRKSDPSKPYDDMVAGITAGKQVACFKVVPKQNETVSPIEVAQFFRAKIRMRGVTPGLSPVDASTPTVDLGDEREVIFYVPPKAPGQIF